VDVFVLTYRRLGELHLDSVERALEDDQRSMCFIRADARRQLDANNIGVTGLSAVGHLAATPVTL
jgi:acetyl esterase/lipase